MQLTETLEKYKNDIYIELFSILGMTSGSLLDPCYNPPVSSLIKKKIKNKLWNEISASGDFDFKKYISNRVYKETSPYKLLRDDTVWFLILTSIYFKNKKNKDNIDKELTFLSTYILLLKYYTSLSNKHMKKFCDRTKAILALETLSEKSLFSAKNKRVIQNAKSVLNSYTLNSKIKTSIMSSNIGLGLVHISNTVSEKYYNGLKNEDFKKISKLIIIYRSRVSQSFKAYAQHYYDLSSANLNIDSTEQTNISNVIQNILNSNYQGAVYIPENQYKLVMQITSVKITLLEKMYKSMFSNSELFNLIGNMINLLLSEGRYEKLLNLDSVYEWIVIVRGVVATRTKHAIRSMLMQVMQSDSDLMKVYNEKSDSYKHKLLQALGSVLGLAIYNIVKTRSLNQISSMYLKII